MDIVHDTLSVSYKFYIVRNLYFQNKIINTLNSTYL